MEKQKITGAGIIGVLLLVITGMYFTPDQLNNAYICLGSEEVGIFYGGISGTGLSAYPYKENRTHAKKCYSGAVKSTWVSLIKYSEETNISLNTLLNPKIIKVANIGKKYLCGPENCTLLE